MFGSRYQRLGFIAICTTIAFFVRPVHSGDDSDPRKVVYIWFAHDSSKFDDADDSANLLKAKEELQDEIAHDIASHMNEFKPFRLWRFKGTLTKKDPYLKVWLTQRESAAWLINMVFEDDSNPYSSIGDRLERSIGRRPRTDEEWKKGMLKAFSEMLSSRGVPSELREKHFSKLPMNSHPAAFTWHKRDRIEVVLPLTKQHHKWFNGRGLRIRLNSKDNRGYWFAAHGSTFASDEKLVAKLIRHGTAIGEISKTINSAADIDFAEEGSILEIYSASNGN